MDPVGAVVSGIDCSCSSGWAVGGGDGLHQCTISNGFTSSSGAWTGVAWAGAFTWSLVVATDGVGGDVGFGSGGGDTERLAAVGAGVLKGSAVAFL